MADERQFTTREKFKALIREVALRRNVYATRVRAKRMKQSIADYELAIMQAIVADYKAKLKEEADYENFGSDTPAGGGSAGSPTETG